MGLGFGKREVETEFKTLDSPAANDRLKDNDDQFARTGANEMRHESVSENGGGCGEIVEVQGGHIVRSTGKKDRHSKVCTAKGPRDRRVRLSAPTAIQFYDVQDRLGFDRPSKAVDWLIKKAKSAIDDLDQLPPWNPAEMVNSKPRRSKTRISPPQATETESSFLPASMDSDSIADTIKSFFPVDPPHSYQQQPRPSSDLRLSLQSFQNGSTFGNPLGFDSSWEQSHHQRLVTWNNGGVSEGAGGGGFVFASSPQSQLQRGPLQSINTPMIRAWFEPNHHHHHSMTTNDLHHQSYHVPGIAFASSNAEFSGFRIPARFHGEHEEHGGDNKPSSASSDSRH